MLGPILQLSSCICDVFTRFFDVKKFVLARAREHLMVDDLVKIVGIKIR